MALDLCRLDHCLWHTVDLVYASVLYYWLYVLGDLIQYLIILDYALEPKRHLHLWYMIFWMPFYQLYQRIVTTYALLEEIFTRRSFKDGFVPAHVRQATWHW